MILLTSYPLLREDFEKWLFNKPAMPLFNNGYGWTKCIGTLGWLEKQPELLQHFYLTLYAENVGYKIRDYTDYNSFWMIFTNKPCSSTDMFKTFPAAFDRFAQIREKELNNPNR